MISLEGHSVVFDHEALGLGLVEGAHVGAGGLLEVDDVTLHRRSERNRLTVDHEVRQLGCGPDFLPALLSICILKIHLVKISFRLFLFSIH